MTVVPMYAALLAVLFVGLSVRTLLLRRSLKIGLGDAGNSEMLRAIRVHSNFAEYVPLSLLMLCFVEGRGAYPWLVHCLGLGLLAGRVSHAFGVSQANENFTYRVAGMALTLTTLLLSAGYLWLSYLRVILA